VNLSNKLSNDIHHKQFRLPGQCHVGAVPRYPTTWLYSQSILPLSVWICGMWLSRKTNSNLPGAWRMTQETRIPTRSPWPIQKEISVVWEGQAWILSKKDEGMNNVRRTHEWKGLSFDQWRKLGVPHNVSTLSSKARRSPLIANCVQDPGAYAKVSTIEAWSRNHCYDINHCMQYRKDKTK
jgi:hypothetical protein